MTELAERGHSRAFAFVWAAVVVTIVGVLALAINSAGRGPTSAAGSGDASAAVVVPPGLGAVGEEDHVVVEYTVRTLEYSHPDARVVENGFTFDMRGWRNWTHATTVVEGVPATPDRTHCLRRTHSTLAVGRDGCRTFDSVQEVPDPTAGSGPSPVLSPDAFSLLFEDSTSTTLERPGTGPQTGTPALEQWAQAVAQGLGLAPAEVVAYRRVGVPDCGGEGLDCAAFGVQAGSATEVEEAVFHRDTGLVIAYSRSVGDVPLVTHTTQRLVVTRG